MDGLLFLFAIIGMAVIVLWCIQNRDVAPDGRTRGLLAMIEESSIQSPAPMGKTRGNRARLATGKRSSRS